MTILLIVITAMTAALLVSAIRFYRDSAPEPVPAREPSPLVQLQGERSAKGARTELLGALLRHVERSTEHELQAMPFLIKASAIRDPGRPSRARPLLPRFHNEGHEVKRFEAHGMKTLLQPSSDGTFSNQPHAYRALSNDASKLLPKSHAAPSTGR